MSNRNDRAADELEVRSLIARLAQYADGLGSVDQYAELFTVDAEWLMPGAPRRGREDIRAGSNERRAAGGVGPGSNSRHVITTLAVGFDDDDTAIVDSYWLYYVDTHEVPRLTLMGHYHDTVVRTDGGWRMARREIAFG
jgi:uncharacterized protein (TIGR02246 family)